MLVHLKTKLGQILTWCLTNFYLFLPLWASACMEAIVIDIITFTITFMIIARNIIIAVIKNILSHIITVIATIDKIVLMIRKVCLPPVLPVSLQCPRIYFQNRQGSPMILLLKVPPEVTWRKKFKIIQPLTQRAVCPGCRWTPRLKRLRSPAPFFSSPKQVTRC